MAAHYLDHWDLTAIEKQLITQLHTEKSLGMAERHEGDGNIVGYVSVLADCIKYNPYAIPRVIRHFVRSAIKQSVRIVRLVIKKFMA